MSRFPVPSGGGSDFSGSYNDLTDKPTLGTAAAENTPIAVNKGGTGSDTAAAAMAALLLAGDGGRLSLTQDVPILQTTVAAGGSVYLNPYITNIHHVLVAGVRTPISFTSTNGTLAASGTAGQVKTIYSYSNSGTLALEWGAAWDDDVTPKEAFAWVQGLLVKNSDNTRRVEGVAIFNGTNTIGMTTSQMGLCNVMHRRPWTLFAQEATNNWDYTTNTWRESNGGSTLGTTRVGAVQIDGDYDATADAVALFGNTLPVAAGSGIGIDSSSTNSAKTYGAQNLVSGLTHVGPSKWVGKLGVGYHTIRWLEISQASGTTTFYGDQNNPTDLQAGLTATVWG